MWRWSLNWGWITPELVVGTCPMTTPDLARVRDETGVSAVLSLQHDMCLSHWAIDYEAMRQAATALGLEMARCPIRDFDVEDMRRQLPEAVGTLAGLQADGHRTYVHCTAGLGRAPLTLLAYLSWVEGHDPEEAIRMILRGRPGAVPAWEAYHGCREDLVTGHRALIRRRAYELFEQGVHATADENWYRAEVEVLRTVLTAPAGNR